MCQFWLGINASCFLLTLGFQPTLFAHCHVSLVATKANLIATENNVAVVVKTINKIHDTVVSDLVFYVEFYESHLCLCFLHKPCENTKKVDKNAVIFKKN